MKNKSFPKGFSLMELLVVVMVILLILSIGGNTYRNQRKYVQFNDALTKVSGIINKAREYTITSRSVNDLTGCPLEGEEVYIPPNGYGVYISRSDSPGLSRFVLFANTVANGELELNQYNEMDGSPCVSDYIEEEYLLPGEVDFIELSTDKTGTAIGGGADDKAVILFRPPLADATIAANNNPLNSALLVYLDDLYLHFRRPEMASSPSYFIHINKIAGFPETETQ